MVILIERYSYCMPTVKMPLYFALYSLPLAILHCCTGEVLVPEVHPTWTPPDHDTVYGMDIFLPLLPPPPAWVRSLDTVD